MNDIFTPNIPNLDAFNLWKGIRIEFVIRVITNVSGDFYTFAYCIHVDVGYCDVSDKSSAANIGLDVYSYASVEKVNVFC